MPHHLRPALLVVAVLAAAASAACTPIAVPESGSSSPATSGNGYGIGVGQCQPGWVCGTCPDGSSWGYLNDPQYTNDPQVSTLFFNDKHPCG